MSSRSLLCRLAVVLPLVGAASALALPAPLAAAERAAERKFEVESLRDLPYYEGDEADRVKHKLDLYLPRGQKDFPVLFFVHGGAWMHGDKNYFGVYTALGRFFAGHGIGTVVTNYRLSPGVKHPEHIKDVARAFAWTYKNIDKYGGRSDRIFACGHSAGGHLVSLLATDQSYLKAEGLDRRAIRGVMPISGVYAIPDELLPGVFGRDPTARKQAGPIEHVQEGEPPFLILYAERDLPQIDKGSVAFCKRLKDKSCPAELVEVKQRNHMSILLNVCVEDDPASVALLDFIASHAK